MPQFSDIKSLSFYIEQKISETLEDEVARTTIQTMQLNIETEVYNRYSPTQYERKRYSGGLQDKENIETKLISKDTLAVRNIRTDENTGRDVAKVVETGVGYSWRNSGIYKMQPFPRQFTQATRNKLESENLARIAMKRGLRTRGIPVM